ncbi:GNAT family N-acetyltransferase, partial [bacterium]
QIILEPSKVNLRCCAAIPKGNVWKIRQVAVDPMEQGKGLGAALMRAIEPLCDEIYLHARDTAVPFYLRLGYQIVGEPFEEVGIPHRAMRKTTGTEAGSVSS